MDRDTAIGVLFGLDARKVDRAQAKAKARKGALDTGAQARSYALRSRPTSGAGLCLER